MNKQDDAECVDSVVNKSSRHRMRLVCFYCERLRCDRADSKERAYSLSSLAAFSDTMSVPDPEDEVLRIEDRLARELDGDRM